MRFICALLLAALTGGCATERYAGRLDMQCKAIKDTGIVLTNDATCLICPEPHHMIYACEITGDSP